MVIIVPEAAAACDSLAVLDGRSFRINAIISRHGFEREDQGERYGEAAHDGGDAVSCFRNEKI
jgi:hypothetical protein